MKGNNDSFFASYKITALKLYFFLSEMKTKSIYNRQIWIFFKCISFKQIYLFYKFEYHNFGFSISHVACFQQIQNVLSTTHFKTHVRF